MPEAVIIDCLRTAVGKAGRGALRDTRPDDLAAAVLRALARRYPKVAPEDFDDVILGCAMPEGEAGMNLARIALLRAGFPDAVPGMTVNRFCASGLEAIALACDRIRAGGASQVIAGGAESMSLVPFMGARLAPNPWLVERLPDAYLGMGLTAERLRERYGIGREEQDRYALASHEKAVRAQAEGKFDGEIVPVDVERTVVENGTPRVERFEFRRDEGPRPGASLEALAALKPVFHVRGTVTAGNSSQASDGAAAALVMSAARARALGLKPAARLLSYAAAGVPPGIMGAGPAVAIPKALAAAGLNLRDVGVIELNEAFAVQALAVIRLAGLDPGRVNVNGGAIALGHPLGCTGAKLTATLLAELRRRNARYGMVSLCVGGGQGVAAVFERLN